MNRIRITTENIAPDNLWEHKWGIPIAHALLWTIGIFVTTDLLEIQSKLFTPDEKLAVSLGTVIVIFFGEIVFSFLDVVLEQKIQLLNVTFCRYIALLFAISATIVVLMFFGCHFLFEPDTRITGKVLIAVLIFVSAFAKGMEIWLQNNWERYSVDVPDPSGTYVLGYTIEN